MDSKAKAYGRPALEDFSPLRYPSSTPKREITTQQFHRGDLLDKEGITPLGHPCEGSGLLGNQLLLIRVGTEEIDSIGRP